MRKSQQRQILELLETIGEAQSSGLYADCQDGAASIGGFIEELKGEGTPTVALLEEYCELLYKAHNGEIGERSLHKQLIKIENSVKTELKPDRIEIAFISYKASMNDSIESIYLAAKADPNCDAYWIPIPYYDRNPDGSLRTMHYEGAGYYRKSIEITDWREYDIGARRPDAIFTFSPYDSNNYVTSVHPDYYCERLRSLTDMLVYIPYFVALDSVQKDFLTVAGCIYAHKVIVQSEKIRDVYIRAFGEQYGDRFGKPEDKFVALGSAKFDKVVNSRREDFRLPDEWGGIIGNKKVIYYNSSVSSTLQGNAQYLKKLRHILATFRNRDDVALWWRPHPLVETTYKSMRPQLLEEYNAVVADYRRGAWGIYDDTPDLHRALVWSDAYYGDLSSVLIMYGATGKPAMVGSHDVLTDEIRILLSSFCVDDKHIWFSARYANGLIRVDKSTMKAEYVCSFPGEDDYTWIYAGYMYGECAEKDGEIYFAPHAANEVAVYSRSADSIDKITTEHNADGIGDDLPFWGAAITDESIYFTSYNCPVIIRIDTLTKEAYSHAELVKPLDKQSGKKLGLSPPVASGDSIWAIVVGTNAAVEFDTKTYTSAIHRVGKEGWGFSKICFDGDNYWLLPCQDTETPVIKYNPKTGSIKEISEVTSMDPSRSHYILYCGGYVWLLPIQANHAFKIDKDTDGVSIAQEFEPDANDSTVRKYWVAQTHGSSIYAYRSQSDVLIQYNTATKERWEEAIHYPPETLARLNTLITKQFTIDFSSMNTERDCWYHENVSAPLSNFVEHISKNNDSSEEVMRKKRQIQIFKSNNENADGTAGQAICDFVKNLALK